MAQASGLNRKLAPGEHQLLKAFDVALVCPMVVKEQVRGVLLVTRRLSGAAFSENDKEFLSILIGQFAVAMDNARKLMPFIEYVPDTYAAAEGADALVIVTEWNEFRQLDFDRLKKLMRSAVIIDCRNVYDPEDVRKQGFKYFGVGRGVR